MQIYSLLRSATGAVGDITPHRRQDASSKSLIPTLPLTIGLCEDMQKHTHTEFCPWLMLMPSVGCGEASNLFFFYRLASKVL